MALTHPAFEAATRLAPMPASKADATPRAWARYYAAYGFAANTAFHDALTSLPINAEPGSRPDLGYLAAIGVAATTAAVALTIGADQVGAKIWNLTPEAGALNGEWEDWLVRTLDRLGINPADINAAYEGSDFRTPRATVTA